MKTSEPKRRRVLIDTADRAKVTIVHERKSTSIRIRDKRENPYMRCFCEMCWRLTEFEIADEARAVYKVTNAQNVAVRAVSEVVRQI